MGIKNIKKPYILYVLIFLLSFSITPAYATASTLDLLCPATSETTEFTCSLKGHSDSPITSITASLADSSGVTYVSSSAAEESSYSINATASSITITSTEQFSGDFTIGEFTFRVTQPSIDGASVSNKIILSLVIFNNGPDTSFTAIGSESSITTPGAIGQTSNTTQPPKNQTSGTNSSKAEETTKPPLLTIILIIIAVLAVAIVIILLLTRKKSRRPISPNTMVQQPMRTMQPSQLTQPTPQTPVPAIPSAMKPATPAPTPAPQPTQPAPASAYSPLPEPIPEVQNPSGISVENLPFEKASSDHPISFES